MLEIAGALTSKRRAISPDGSAPVASISTMRCRVGSARTFKERMRLFCSHCLIKAICKYEGVAAAVGKPISMRGRQVRTPKKFQVTQRPDSKGKRAPKALTETTVHLYR